jgi:integrase
MTRTAGSVAIIRSTSAQDALFPFQRIPLSPRVFPGGKRGQPLSNMAFLMLLRRMKRDDLTAHGFRSSFRDWAAERTNFPSEVAEMALAHAVSSKVEAAYSRGDLFERRRRLMTAWSTFCGTAKASLRSGDARASM